MHAVLFIDTTHKPYAPLDENSPSCTLMMGGRCLLCHWIYQLHNAGVNSVSIVSPEHQAIADFFDDERRQNLGVELHFLPRYEPVRKAAWLIDASSLLDAPINHLMTKPPKHHTAYTIDDEIALIHFNQTIEAPLETWGEACQLEGETTALNMNRLRLSSLQDYHRTTLDIIRDTYSHIKPAGIKLEGERIYSGEKAKFNPESLKTGAAYIGHHTRVHRTAELSENVAIEDDCIIEFNTKIRDSIILDHTFVGGLTEVNDAIVKGRLLIRIDTGDMIEMPDDFILSNLSEHKEKSLLQSIFGD